MTTEDFKSSSDDKPVRIHTRDGEEMIVKVISVFDGESDPDLFYELISTSRPELYVRRDSVGVTQSRSKTSRP
jgi:hypothetical protein